MANYKETWLPKYREIPKSAYGFPTCMYAMSLEAWRRGFEVTFKLKSKRRMFHGITYTVSDGNKIHYFDGSRGDISEPETVKICRNKGLTNDYLRKANVPIPKGKAFDKDADNDEILNYADKIGYPLVLKPIDGGGGAGVVTNIQSRSELEKHLIDLRYNRSKKEVIVERFIVGEDYRILVLDGMVIGAFHRRAQSVVGDGKSTIEVLLKRKNKERKASPFLKRSKIKIDDDMIAFLIEQNKSIDYIPAKGERVFLRRNGEYFGQRDSINITEELLPEIKQIAINAVNAIPGLKYGGVDMLVNLEKNEYVVNEVNSKPQIGNHLFPIEGEAIDIPRIIFDYYFPETKYINTPNEKYFYDFEPISRNFKDATASEIKLPELPEEGSIARKYAITGAKIKRKHLNKIKREARGLSISGKIEVLSENSFELTILGSNNNINKLIYYIKNKILSEVDNVNIVENEYDGPIKIGIEIINKVL